MTREEIKNTPELVDFMLDQCVLADSREKVRKRLEEVCDLAIKALEQEPCSDAISRQAVNALIDELARAISAERWGVPSGRSTASIMREILHLPPVMPQLKANWIIKHITHNAVEHYTGQDEMGETHTTSEMQEDKDKKLTRRTKSEKEAYLDGFEMCAECIQSYLHPESRKYLRHLLVVVKNTLKNEDIEPKESVDRS